MAKKTEIDLVVDNNVAAGATVTTTTPVVPLNTRVTVRKFGGYVANGLIVLQWGSGGSFTTIRAFGGTFEFELKKDFIGDGAKLFRLVRINNDTTSKPIVAWMEAFLDDA